MEPAVVSVVIKSDRLRKRYPKIGEMVRIEDRKGLFRVMRVDAHQRLADLMQRVGDVETLELNVAFSMIHGVPKGASRAIQEFLRS